MHRVSDVKPSKEGIYLTLELSNEKDVVEFEVGHLIPADSDWRVLPVLELDLGAPVKRAVGYFYGGKESYGYHGVEVFQSMVERRKGGETGVEWVQCIEGADAWKWSEANPPNIWRASIEPTKA